MSELQISFKVGVSIQKDDEINAWVAACSPFDVWSQGKTKKEALDNIHEALNIFLVSCFDRGTLDEVMKQCGVKPSNVSQAKSKAKKASAQTKNIDVAIPFDVFHSAGQTPCHA